MFRFCFRVRARWYDGAKACGLNDRIGTTCGRKVAHVKQRNATSEHYRILFGGLLSLHAFAFRGIHSIGFSFLAATKSKATQHLSRKREASVVAATTGKR